MELTNDFRVGVALDRAWEVLTDVERIAPLLPGAQLQEVEGDHYRGIVKVKVGPIQAKYKGVASFLERDRAAGRMVLEAKGRDTRGQGNANATITAVLTDDGGATKVSVVTDLTITGKVAQFGRGVLADVSAKLITQFVDALEADLAAAPAAPAPAAPAPAAAAVTPEAAPETAAVAPEAAPAPAAVAPEAASETAAAEPLVGDADAHEPVAVVSGLDGVLDGGAVGSGTTAPLPEGARAASSVSGAPPSPAAASSSAPPASSAAAGAPTAAPGIRRIDSPEAEPVDLLDAAGGSVAKRLVPALGVLGALVILLVVRRRRSRAGTDAPGRR